MHTVRSYVRGDGVTVYQLVYYDPHPKRDCWVLLGESEDRDNALAYASYLNGGSKPAGPPP